MKKEGKTLLNYVWCKVCAKFKTQIESSSNVKGSEKTSASAFINGTNSVTKHQVWIYSVIYTCLVYKIFFLDCVFGLTALTVYRERYSLLRAEFRTQSTIYGGAFLQK